MARYVIGPDVAIRLAPSTWPCSQLRADGLITLDRQFAHAVKDLVTVAHIETLY